MRGFLFLLCFSFCSGKLFSQPVYDSVWQKIKAEEDSISRTTKDTPGQKKSTVIITSGSSSDAKRDNSTWDNRWKNHIDKESIKIAGKIIQTSTSKSIYKVLVDFSINEDGSLRDLTISCKPNNDFIIKECRKMVLSAPKKSPAYKNGKYVRPHITQPIDIKVR